MERRVQLLSGAVPHCQNPITCTLRSTELLTRWSGEGGGGRGVKLQWLPYAQMNEEHKGHPLAVYFQGRVYVVGYGKNVNEMEMLDVGGSGQWTTLAFSSLPFRIESMATVGNELFVHVPGTPGPYSTELHGDPKVSSLEEGLYSRLSIWRFLHLFSPSPVLATACYMEEKGICFCL
ncbi:unnamed protein product [Hymenolepis diminuta]|uniref:F-box/kelch-repeat protein n=1 Tax=Hymenolepis diminuta TaxID=6216 RepID=A0A0R3SJ96_HYMDI|nr:unnamed protein product [Hymenolepis diminuta]